MNYGLNVRRYLCGLKPRPSLLYLEPKSMKEMSHVWLTKGHALFHELEAHKEVDVCQCVEQIHP